jgi:hypothetical protein
MVREDMSCAHPVSTNHHFTLKPIPNTRLLGACALIQSKMATLYLLDSRIVND